MNGIGNKKAQNMEKQFPGCLGRMVNLFDLSNGVAGNRLLTDKPHRDVSSLSRSRSDGTKILSTPFGDPVEDKKIISELRRSSSNKKSNGTPMKMLIAREMSKEVDYRNNPPNVVAKLMGLDTLPHHQPNSATERSHSKGYSRRSLSHSGVLDEGWEQDNGFLDDQMCSKGHQHEDQNVYRDVHEIWQQSHNLNVRDSSPHKGGHHENPNERQMSLVRQKFMEAKRLATDEKGRQSREFQDALEVLSSNRHLFLKFLQEPNSMFSPHLYDVQSTPPETKRITVLRPSKVIDNEKFSGSKKIGDKQSKKVTSTGQSTVWNKNHYGGSPIYANQRFEEYPAQPTRIVVLKPSPGRTHDVKAVVSPPPSSPRTLPGEEFYGEPADDEAQESREVAMEVAQQMHENLMGHRRDETQLSSVFSNGYIGDDSSFNKSENEYALGNVSDSEIMSPTSRHSWDYLNRFGSPYSSSSFSRASCSPESSVCREAKKRLSERWAMMASNGSSQEPKNSRSSSTLGEMLALSDVKKSGRSEVEATNKEQEPRKSNLYSSSNLNEEKDVTDSPKSLMRSRSVPVSATVFGAGLSVESSDSDAGNMEIPQELRKAKSAKSSLRGKVSSLLFSRSKKTNKEKDGASQSNVKPLSATSEMAGSQVPAFSGKSSYGASRFANDKSYDNCSTQGIHGPSSKTAFPDSVGVTTKQGLVSQEGALSVAKPAMPSNIGENQDQPSPISVLELPFEEDDSTAAEPSGNFRLNCQGAEVPLRSNLIDKSPPIESIARTLSWDDIHVETTTPYSIRPSSISAPLEEDEQDWPLFIQTLLSAAGLDGNVQLDSFSSIWHSPESPLDPALRNKYANLEDKELLHEARRRQRRSNRKLVFDSMNAELIEIARCRFDTSPMAVPCIRGHNRFTQGTSILLGDHLWDQMKAWFCSEVSCSYEEGGDRSSLVVERVVRKEVVGEAWADNNRKELDNLGKEIEDKLLAELVEDAVVDLTN